MHHFYTLQLLPTTDACREYYKEIVERDVNNAGFDLHVPEEVRFAPGERKLVSMQVKATLIRDDDRLVHYWMAPRSSLSKTGLILCNSMGVIDLSYRGELMAFLWNTLDREVVVQKGDRLVQILAPDMGDIQTVKLVKNLGETERGVDGFGSTGR